MPRPLTRQICRSDQQNSATAILNMSGLVNWQVDLNFGIFIGVMKKSMKIRIAFGLAMLTGVVAVLWLDWFLQQRGFRHLALPVTAVLLLVTIVAFRELARMSKALGVAILSISGLLGTVAVAALPVWWSWVSMDMIISFSNCYVMVLLGVVMAMIFLEQIVRYRIADAIRQIAATTLAVLYLGVGLSLILQIRVDFGVPVLVLFLAAVKLTDIGAYFTGSAIGKHKMIPWLSPGKSWEGLAGGVITAAGTAVLITWLLQIDVFGPALASSESIWKTLAFGAILGGTGQFADLCESLLKRSAGVKDSGALVPEFGGMLDIIDSPILASPIAVILLNILK
jgi:phosphatidate cytidylyltransferase